MRVSFKTEMKPRRTIDDHPGDFGAYGETGNGCRARDLTSVVLRARPELVAPPVDGVPHDAHTSLAGQPRRNGQPELGADVTLADAQLHGGGRVSAERQAAERRRLALDERQRLAVDDLLEVRPVVGDDEQLFQRTLFMRRQKKPHRGS